MVMTIREQELLNRMRTVRHTSADYYEAVGHLHGAMADMKNELSPGDDEHDDLDDGMEEIENIQYNIGQLTERIKKMTGVRD